MSASTDITGQKFGMLTVIERNGIITSGIKSITTQSRWLCKCECGKETTVGRNNLKSGTTKSCGCLQYTSEKKKIAARENLKKARDIWTTHGLSTTRLYGIWKSMLNRCNNSRIKVYKDYGGRGITVCKEWYELEHFNGWALKNGYDDNLEIDRINNNGNYEPSNCRWATRKEQTNNKRDNIRVKINEEEHTLSQWAEITNIVINTLQYRYHRGDRGTRLIRPVDKKYKRNSIE